MRPAALAVWVPLALGLAAAAFALAFGAWVVTTGYSTASPGSQEVHGGGFPGFGVLAVALLFLLWPTLLSFAVARDARWLAIAAVVAYAAQSLLFGLGLGGPHLQYGVPLAGLCLLSFLALRRWRHE